MNGVRSVELDVDPFELEETLKKFRQGDVLDVARMTWLFSPDHPLNPDEEEVDAGEPVAVQGRLSNSGLAVIVSQTCDIWRLPDVEPFLTLCPLVELNETRYAEAEQGLSVRYFPYPEILNHEDKERLAVDSRLFFSLEKPALLSKHIEHVECPLPGPGRGELRLFLAQRLGRPDLPDEIIEHLVRPVEQAFKRVYDNGGFEHFFASVRFYGIAWTPGAAGASVLVLTSQARRQKNKVSEDDIKAVHKRLRNALGHWMRESPYEAAIQIHDADLVPAIEVLQHVELRFDLEAANLDE